MSSGYHRISCLKWGFSSTYATYAHNAADDPDSWSPIWPPAGLEWLDDFIQDVCHCNDHYYDPVLGTGYAPPQCEKTQSLAGYAKSYDDELFYLAYNHRYTLRTDADVRSITENCLLDTEKYSLGLVKYVRD